jgi:hypothetical protein
MFEAKHKGEKQSPSSQNYLYWVVWAIPACIFLWEGAKGFVIVTEYINTPVGLIIIGLIIFIIISCVRNKNHVARNYIEAKKSAEQGNADGQFNLGEFYHFGGLWRVGWKVDLEEAVKWYLLAADQKHVRAQNILGHMYINGEGVEKNLKEALKWWRFAADQGDLDARKSLQALLKEHPELHED